MAVYKSKKKENYYFIDGHVVINNKSYHYSKESIKDKNFKSKRWLEDLEKRIIQNLKEKYEKSDIKIEGYTLNDLARDYAIKMESDDKKRSTIKGFKYKYEKYYKPCLNGDLEVNKCFNEENILSFKMKIKNMELSSEYKNTILNTLKNLINYSARRKLISYEKERILVDDLECFKNFDAKSNVHKYTSPEDAKKVWNNASNEYYRYVFELLYYSGCRISEFMGIKLKDVSFSKALNGELIASVSIYKQRFSLKDEALLYLKNASSIRTTYFVGEVAKHFEEFLTKFTFSEDDFIFPISKNTLRRELNKAFKKANVEHNTFHGFGRKSIATYLYLESKDGKLPQLLLGHKNVDMTLNTYVLESSMKNELLNKLSEIER